MSNNDISSYEDFIKQFADNENISDEKLKLLHELYESLSFEQEKQFLKTHNLFHAPFLSPFPLDMTDKEEQEETLFNELIASNPSDERITKYIDKIDNRLKKGKHRIVINCEQIESRYLKDSSFMTVLDETNFGDLLVLAKEGMEERNIKLFEERLKNGFDASDLYSLDYTIARQLLPKMIEKFRDTTHSYPSNITYEEWKTILTKMIWFFNEILSDYSTQTKKEDVDAYNKQMKECKELFVEYFSSLWD
jgi:hypothetical protein